MFSIQHATANKMPTTQPMHAKLPDGTYMHSTHTDNMDIPALLPSATQTSIFPALDTSLISIGQLCDAGCTAVFNQHTADIRFNNTTILTGTRVPPGLWYYQLPETAANSAISSTTATLATKNAKATSTSSITDHIQFLHAAAFSPVTSTWIDAINNGHFTTWPGLTAEAVKRYLPKSLATAQGHLDQARKNQRSTKSTIATELPEPIIPTPEPNNNKTNYAYAKPPT